MYENGLEQKNLKFVPPLKRFYFFKFASLPKGFGTRYKGAGKMIVTILERVKLTHHHYLVFQNKF